MSKLNIDLNDLTHSALKRLVAQLLAATEGEEKQLLNRVTKKNDLADLDEEMHGKPNTPKVEDDDLSDDDDELPPVPKKRKG